MTLRLRTFGAVYLERDGSPLGGAHSQRRRLALLTYLAAHPQPMVAREKLLALLWPESDDSSARHSLSQLLYALRHDLGQDVLVVGPETVRLNHEALPSDVRAFDDALKGGEYAAAIELYRGAFLDGFHVGDAPDLDRWIEEERARRAVASVRALDSLANAAERAQSWHRAVDWLRQRTALEPTDARTTIRLMQALAAIGDREGALRAARTYETLVRHELESDADPAVLQLARQLRTAQGDAQPILVPVAGAPPAAPTGAPAIPPAAPAVSRSRIRARRSWFAGAIIAVLIAAVLVTRVGGGPVGVFGDARNGAAIVVIGDLAGPDPMLALAVREALRAELVNMRGVLLTSDRGMRELKTLMRLPLDSSLDATELLALAMRGGAHVAVTGSVVPVGDGAQIMLELVEPATGRTIRSFTERPDDAPGTLQAVDRLARAIGSAVSRAPLDASVQPLPSVTTASLAALKSYALARQTAAMGHRHEAVAPAERAVSHDSTFVLAHYFLGDLLWFIDEQTHSEAHLTKAYELRSTVGPREQLVIRARYEQLARDQPDSALAYWQLLADASPGDVLAYEGRAWALRALGRHEEAAASADTAMSLDPGAILPNITNAMYSWLSVGDTSSALAIARRVAPRFPAATVEACFYAALFNEPAAALPWADSTTNDQSRHWRRHLALVALGDVTRARVMLDSVLADDNAQFPPNALLNQAWLELALRGDSTAAVRYVRTSLDWMRQRDLSPPAIGRLAERIADVAARAGDAATIRSLIALVRERDRGRSLRTYVLTLRALDAALAFERGDYAVAARLAEQARHGVYFSRSLTTLVLLESDARRAAGQVAAGDSLARLVHNHEIVDGNFEMWAVLRAVNRLRGTHGLTAAAR